jgi:hypothetical protein
VSIVIEHGYSGVGGQPPILPPVLSWQYLYMSEPLTFCSPGDGYYATANPLGILWQFACCIPLMKLNAARYQFTIDFFPSF